MGFEERKNKLLKIEQELLDAGVTGFRYYNLINNYGYIFIYKGVKYDLRHIHNCYGACVDYWSLFPANEALNDIQNLIIKYDSI